MADVTAEQAREAVLKTGARESRAMWHHERETVLTYIDQSEQRAAEQAQRIAELEREREVDKLALRSLAKENAELRRRDPERKCGRCGHAYQDHSWELRWNKCDCSGFVEPESSP